MYMDYYLSFVLFFILMIIVVMISELIRIEVEVFVFPIFLFTVSQNIVQDFIFHRSIGKRIYRLKIETNIETKKKLLKALAMRRFYEATYHPLLNKDFAAIVNMIEAMTETKIVDDIKKQDL